MITEMVLIGACIPASRSDFLKHPFILAGTAFNKSLWQGASWLPMERWWIQIARPWYCSAPVTEQLNEQSQPLHLRVNVFCPFKWIIPGPYQYQNPVMHSQGNARAQAGTARTEYKQNVPGDNWNSAFTQLLIHNFDLLVQNVFIRNLS